MALAVLGQSEQGPTPQAPVPAPPATPEPPPPPPPPPCLLGKVIECSFLGDVYYTKNFNEPSNGYNALYNFNVRANLAHLNMAKFSLEKPTGIFGFRVDVGAGQVYDVISAFDRAPDGMKYVHQAFIEIRPNHLHGVQFDFGKFVTSAGAEVIETNANWNYSRSLLFAWAIPYYHLGFRATIPVTKSFTAGVQLVNGWNNVSDNNDGKTLGLVANYTWKKVTWSNNYYTGPENDDTNKGFRNLYDTTILVNPTDKLSAYLNFDYATNKLVNTTNKWSGVAVAARYQLTKQLAIAPRVEVFSDKNGYSTGTAQRLTEFTLTGEVKVIKYLVTRLEYRRDNSDQAFFGRSAKEGFSKSQSTFTVGMFAYFGK